MRRPGGYAITVDHDGRTRERDTVTCAHCSVVVFVRVGEDPGGFCRLCMRHLCARCGASGVCTPFERRLEAEERRARLMRALKE